MEKGTAGERGRGERGKERKGEKGTEEIVGIKRERQNKRNERAAMKETKRRKVDAESRNETGMKEKERNGK